MRKRIEAEKAFLFFIILNMLKKNYKSERDLYRKVCRVYSISWNNFLKNIKEMENRKYVFSIKTIPKKIYITEKGELFIKKVSPIYYKLYYLFKE